MAEHTDELRLRLALALTQKFSSLHQAKLIDACGSLTEVLNQPLKRILALQGMNQAKLDAWREMTQSAEVEEELARCEAADVHLVMPQDPLFPPLLRKIADPPLLLWVKGALTHLDQLAVAIVGSRESNTYGNRQATRFARDLCEREITVVSGMARGIDTAAHRAAIEAGGRTIAVVGSGLGKLYPPENIRLAEQIADSGAVVSEFPMLTPATPKNFPRRNRLISGLCVGVIVIQAGTRSGSLITARLGAEQGREVFAVPGRVEEDAAQGCHELIRTGGAKLVENITHVLEELPGFSDLPAEALAAPKEVRPATSTPTEAAIVKHLRRTEAINVEELIMLTGLPPVQLNPALLILEMQGVISQLPGRNFVLK